MRDALVERKYKRVIPEYRTAFTARRPPAAASAASSGAASPNVERQFPRTDTCNHGRSEKLARPRLPRAALHGPWDLFGLVLLGAPRGPIHMRKPRMIVISKLSVAHNKMRKSVSGRKNTRIFIKFRTAFGPAWELEIRAGSLNDDPGTSLPVLVSLDYVFLGVRNGGYGITC
ncbi:hypothetical protein EVAR_27613_1 [Eumeta japonica]|uniref:Uncharacterized protein n=1 Tax=Eumeta variegata TaxID=151549 RepID=A0A4C1V100_EUMVA|nr:hypothetical protein EVAR_27613_1 [Eumeta japonica]